MGRIVRQKGAYKERDINKKNIKFNDHMMEHTKRYIRSLKGAAVSIYTMDAALARTAEYLRINGVNEHITAFTNNEEHYREIPIIWDNFDVMWCDALVLYPKIRTEHKNVVVIHDSSQTGRNVLSDIELLIGGRLKSIALGVNTSARDGEYGREILINCVEDIANENGYYIEYAERFDVYNQGLGPMAPFFIVMRKRE